MHRESKRHESMSCGREEWGFINSGNADLAEHSHLVVYKLAGHPKRGAGRQAAHPG
jgi:hypothetical protein